MRILGLNASGVGGALIGVLAALIATLGAEGQAPSGQAPSPPAATTLRLSCASEGYDYRRCVTPADAALVAARLVDRKSRRKCKPGKSWGWDGGGVWVDRGCRASFDVDLVRGGVEAEVLACGSEGYARRACPASGLVYAARLETRRSSAACVFGETWGFDAAGVWTAEGCRGDFVINDRADLAVRPPAPEDGGLMARLRGRDAQGDVELAIAACSRRLIESAWAAGDYSAQFDAPPSTLADAAGGWRVVGSARAHGGYGYRRFQVRCRALDGRAVDFDAS